MLRKLVEALQGVAERKGTLRERYGALMEPLQKILILPITN